MRPSGPHREVSESNGKTESRWIRGQSGGVYEVVRDLPAGGMAEAFVAVRHGLGGFAFPCCVKRMLGAEREEFLQEAHILGNLAHDRIVRAFEVDEDEDGVCFIAMELVDGVNLGELLTYYQRRCQRMPPSLCLYVANEVLEALEYAHGRVLNGEALHIVHRDVTPSNILVSRDGYVKLADFGIARFKTRPDFTRTGIAKGKASYMSPEHYDKRRGLDHRSDLFSLGATLYEMIAGERAFHSNSDEESLYAVLHGGFQPLQDFAPQVDRDLAELVHRLLDPDKHKRPRDAEEVRVHLRAFEQHASPRAALARDVEACIALEEVTEHALRRRAAARRLAQPSPHISSAPVTDDDEPDTVPDRHADPSIRITDVPQQTRSPEDREPTSLAGPAAPLGMPVRSPVSRRVAPVGASLAVVIVAVAVLWVSRHEEASQGVPASVPDKASSEPPSSPSAPSQTPTAHPMASPLQPINPAIAPGAGDLSLLRLAPLDGAPLPSAAPDRTRAHEERLKTGALRIKVRAPHGFAWIDGRCYGRAPVLVKDLSAGTYAVGASTDEKAPPSRTKHVKVVAGREGQVEVLLFDPFT